MREKADKRNMYLLREGGKDFFPSICAGLFSYTLSSHNAQYSRLREPDPDRNRAPDERLQRAPRSSQVEPLTLHLKNAPQRAADTHIRHRAHAQAYDNVRA